MSVTFSADVNEGSDLNVANGNAGCVVQLLADALGRDPESFDVYGDCIPAESFGDGVQVIARLKAVCLEEHKKPTIDSQEPGKCRVISLGIIYFSPLTSVRE